MRPIKTRPKFHCDFCRRTSTKEAMEKHEKICWRNPSRYCDSCKNTGYYYEEVMEYIGTKEPCYFCSQIKPELVLGENYFA